MWPPPASCWPARRSTSCSSPPATSIRRGRPSRSTRTAPVWEAGPDELRAEQGGVRAGGRGARCRGRVTPMRAGLIVGPNDGVFRLPWWVRRIAHGGACPGARAARARHAGRSTRATSPPGCSTWPSGAWRARSTPTGRSARPRWASAAARRSRRPPPAPSSSGARTAAARRGRAVDRGAAVGAEDEMPGAWRIGTARAPGRRPPLPAVAETVRDVMALAARRRRGRAHRLGLASRAPPR